MKDLLTVPHGHKILCQIEGSDTLEAIISRNDARGLVYICQNVKDGSRAHCTDFFGKRFSWVVGRGDAETLRINRVLILEGKEDKISRKARVSTHLDGLNMYPLVFVDALNGEIYTPRIAKTASLKYVTDRVLTTMNLYASLCPRTGIRETSHGRRRSSIDIYRHVLSLYKKEVTMFDVMSTLYDMVANEDYWTQSVCSLIGRRVFFTRDGISRPASAERDEFGLLFSDWWNINKEVK